MKKKIAVLFMQSQSYFGSDSMIHSLLMRYHDRERMEVHVACNPGPRGERSASIEALAAIPDLYIRPTLFGPTVFAQSKLAVAKNMFSVVPMTSSLIGLAGYIKQHQIDVIHCTEKPRDAFYGLLLARLTGAKCVIHVHVKGGDWMSPLTRWAMHQADALIGVSQFVADALERQGYGAHKIHAVLNSLDLASWNTSVDGETIRREFGLAPDMPVLAIISRLFPWKGHTELLHALAKVKGHTSHFRLLLVGEDDPRATPGQASYTAQLKALVKELDLTEQIIFTGFRKDVVNILAACDIFTMPSFEEPCAVAYLEAMAMRKPIIALNNGGTLELVEHGKAGLLSSPQDIDGLAENILKLINDPTLRRSMGEHGRARCDAHLNPRRMTTETEAVYRQILGMTSADPEWAAEGPTFHGSHLLRNER